MGWRCGYLALMSGLATGAERVYLHEEGVTLKSMKEDLDVLVRGFQNGKRLGLVIRNEKANPTYTTAFMCALFEEESGGAFDVRQSILGHLQQGGDPSPFDRIQATKLARRGGLLMVPLVWLMRRPSQEEHHPTIVADQATRISRSHLERESG